MMRLKVIILSSIDMLKSYRILSTQIRVELKKSVAEMKLGILWWFIEPMLMALIYYFLVTVVFNHGGEQHHIFILSGLVVWQGFNKGIMGATKSIPGSAAIVLQTRFPLDYLIIAPIIANMVYTFIGLLLVFIITWSSPTIYILYIFPLLFIQFFFTLGVAYFTSVFQVFVRDTAKFMSFVLRAAWFMSPVLYGTSRIMESEKITPLLKDVYMLNPFAHLIPLIRDAIFYGNEILFSELYYILILSGSIFVLGFLFFNKNKSYLAKYL